MYALYEKAADGESYRCFEEQVPRLAPNHAPGRDGAISFAQSTAR